MITIKLDYTLDVEMYLDFLNLVIGGVNFGEKITVTHPSITQENHKEYIQTFYKKNQSDLEQSARELQEVINNTSSVFFVAVEELFKEDFSNATYTGALSIFDLNPRFVDKKTFQVFYKRDLLGKLGVAYHEILHFIFFDYCEEHCSDMVYGRDVNNGAYWELSELFNVLALNQPTFQEVLKRPEQLFYPALATVFPDIEKLWHEYEQDIPQFVKESLSILDAKNAPNPA